MTGKSKRRRPLRWYRPTLWRSTLLGGTILAGAALWVAAMINLARQHF